MRSTPSRTSRFSIIALALLPLVSLAQQPPGNFRDVVSMVLSFLQGLTGIAWILLLVAFIFNVIRFLVNFEDERSREQGKRAMVFTIVATAFALMVWGIISFLSNSVFGQGRIGIRLLTPPAQQAQTNPPAPGPTANPGPGPQPTPPTPTPQPTRVWIFVYRVSMFSPAVPSSVFPNEQACLDAESASPYNSAINWPTAEIWGCRQITSPPTGWYYWRRSMLGAGFNSIQGPSPDQASCETARSNESSIYQTVDSCFER